MQDGANVHVDETWLRYQTYNEKRKTYMWCLVNRKARIVIFFYEDTEAPMVKGNMEEETETFLWSFLVMPVSSHFRVTAIMSICIWMMNLWMQNISVVWHTQEPSLNMPINRAANRLASSLRRWADSIS